jgi:hypothetical protein
VDLGDHAAVLAALTPAVLAPAAVEPRRANVPPEVGKLAARHAELLRLITERQQRGETLDAEQCQELQEAQQALTARLGAAAPALVELTGSRAALAPGRIGHFSMPFDQQVPFGTAVDQQWDPCPPCGMMAVPLAMRSTLKLLAQ